VADEVVGVAEDAVEVVGLLLEVDSLERRPRRIAAAGHEDALEPVGQRTLP
jgi:hypothetical protein